MFGRETVVGTTGTGKTADASAMLEMLKRDNPDLRFTVIDPKNVVVEPLDEEPMLLLPEEEIESTENQVPSKEESGSQQG